jgi:outer membrane biosynthesis protein TonB
MKPIRFASATALFASLAFSCAQLAAQEPSPSNQEPNKHEVSPPREKDASPPRKQEEEKTPKHPETKLPEPQPETKPPKTEKQEVPQPSKEKPAHEEHGTSMQQGKARPSGKSAHIPDPQFKAHFGKQHTFAVNRVVTTTTIVPNQTQFVYTGYTFIFLDPWPADWLFTDDCYIDYVDDEYFLFDAFHPGIRVALFVVG